MQFEKIPYGGWENCYRLSNGLIDLVITGDVGPRIIRFGFNDEPNMFAEFEEMMGKTGGTNWRIYGGHRLWHAPEKSPRTYALDNSPIQIEQHDDQYVRIVQPTEPTTGIQKSIDLMISPDAAHVRVAHRLTNENSWAVELAPWALSVMAPGGTAVVPLPPRGSHPEDLEPVNSLTMWAYTDMADPRWTWGTRYILLRQQSDGTPQKVGVGVPDGWVAYVNDGRMFLKTFTHAPGRPYPDMGSSVEVFTNQRMLEVETLHPLIRLEPGASAQHIENWFLFRDVPTPQNDDDVAAHVLPNAQQMKSSAG